jgi:hypothetical protein
MRTRPSGSSNNQIPRRSRWLSPRSGSSSSDARPLPPTGRIQPAQQPGQLGIGGVDLTGQLTERRSELVVLGAHDVWAVGRRHRWREPEHAGMVYELTFVGK